MIVDAFIEALEKGLATVGQEVVRIRFHWMFNTLTIVNSC